MMNGIIYFNIVSCFWYFFNISNTFMTYKAAWKYVHIAPNSKFIESQHIFNSINFVIFEERSFIHFISSIKNTLISFIHE